MATKEKLFVIVAKHYLGGRQKGVEVSPHAYTFGQPSVSSSRSRWAKLTEKEVRKLKKRLISGQIFNNNTGSMEAITDYTFTAKAV